MSIITDPDEPVDKRDLLCNECLRGYKYKNNILCGHCFEEIDFNKIICITCIVHNHANTYIDNNYYVLCSKCLIKYSDDE